MNITSYEIHQLLDRKIAEYYLKNNNGDLNLQNLIEQGRQLAKELSIVDIYTDYISDLMKKEINEKRLK